MTPQEYIDECYKCVEIAKRGKDQHSYDTYYGMLCGAREMVRLAKCGYDVANVKNV